MTKQNKIILKIFTGLVLIVLILIVADFLLPKGWDYYNQWKGEKKIDELVKEIKRIEKEDYEQKLADKIGGKTPQETLDLFIQAIEKNDYELASKYFIIEKQEEVKKELLALKEKNNLMLVINFFKNAEPDGNIINGNFRMKSKTNLGPDYFIRFILYPSGNWKIEEI